MCKPSGKVWSWEGGTRKVSGPQSYYSLLLAPPWCGRGAQSGRVHRADALPPPPRSPPFQILITPSIDGAGFTIAQCAQTDPVYIYKQFTAGARAHNGTRDGVTR